MNSNAKETCTSQNLVLDFLNSSGSNASLIHLRNKSIVGRHRLQIRVGTLRKQDPGSFNLMVIKLGKRSLKLSLSIILYKVFNQTTKY